MDRDDDAVVDRPLRRQAGAPELLADPRGQPADTDSLTIAPLWLRPFREAPPRRLPPLADHETHLRTAGQRFSSSGTLRNNSTLLDATGAGFLDFANRAVSLHNRFLGRGKRLALDVGHQALFRASARRGCETRQRARCHSR